MNSKKVFATLLFWAFTTLAIAQTRPTTDSLVLMEFESKILAEKRRIVVHLPLNYAKEATKRYPVMYVLDGGSQDFQTADKLFVLAAANMVPECIVVGILNTKTSRNRDQTPPFMPTETDDLTSPLGKADGFLAFMERELIPKIDSNYRSSRYRSIAGHSRAGLFVLYTLMAHPDLFDARFAYSTPVWRFNDMMIKKIEQFLEEKRLKRPSFLFLSAGLSETDNIIGGNKRLAEMLDAHAQKNLTLRIYLTPLANHQQNPLIATSMGLTEWGKFYFKKPGK